jgi:hypothetical protein
MPALHSLLAELAARPAACRGAQLLDFLAAAQSGLPVVNSMLQR